MRLFQCAYDALSDYSWADRDDYRESYKEQIAAALVTIAKRGECFTACGIPQEDPAKAVQGLILTERQVTDLLLCGFPPKVERAIPIEDSLEGELIIFREIASKLLKLPAPERVFNEKVEVHMPGQALSLYNDILLLTDDCSDDLQQALDNGWRIIAACPQPDQRRPDYIMGRFNPEKESNREGAKRRA